MSRPYGPYYRCRRIPVTVKRADDVSHLHMVQPYGVRFESVLAVAFMALALGFAAAKGWGVL